MTSNAYIVQLESVSKHFGSFQALRNISLSVRPGEKVVICGPSGSGKSTMIRCVNRLERHESGRITVDGLELTDDARSLQAIRCEVGMVFQSFNLFPHLSVIDNLTLGPMRVRNMSRKEAEDVAMHFLQRVRIPEQAQKYPHQPMQLFRELKAHVALVRTKPQWARRHKTVLRLRVTISDVMGRALQNDPSNSCHRICAPSLLSM